MAKRGKKREHPNFFERCHCYYKSYSTHLNKDDDRWFICNQIGCRGVVRFPENTKKLRIPINRGKI